LINFCDRWKFIERAIVRIIPIDQQTFIDTKLKNWIYEQEIKRNWFAINISEQNKKFERLNAMLIEKAKYFCKHAKLSKILYSECYFATTHILNRTSIQSLDWDFSWIAMHKLLKWSIKHEIFRLKFF
jgi:hypothetical protein